jgi:hypothetical protein
MVFLLNLFLANLDRTGILPAEMSEQSLEEELQKPPAYLSLLLDEARLWNEARLSARYPNSLFIKVPKNAGTSVHHALRPYGLVKLKTVRAVRLCFSNAGRVSFDHMSVGGLIALGVVKREFVDSAFKFTLCRDPYDRAVSLYRYLSDYSYLNWHKWPTFTEFLRLIAAGHYERIGPYNDRGLSQANPQVEWLRDVRPDKIYKVENLDEFIRDISKRWGIKLGSMPHLNRSPGHGIELRREDKALIEQIYAEDFERFGYAKR